MYVPWTKHFLVFFGQPLIMVSGPQCHQEKQLGVSSVITISAQTALYSCGHSDWFREGT